jgi:ribonuclease D
MSYPLLYIDTATELSRFTDSITESQFIAVDSEFMRRSTYFPMGGLLQVSNGKLCAIIDLVALAGNIESLIPILEDNGIQKVFHSASEDMELLYKLTGVDSFCGIVDTQILATILYNNQGVGFKALVEKVLGVSLDKQETRSDWLKRPLTSRQIQYAADDVHYLYQAYPMMLEKLDGERLKEMFNRECDERFKSADAFRPDPEKAYRRVGQWFQLNSKERKYLYLLAKWREETAIQENKPKSFVVKDDVITIISQRQPQSIENLSALGLLKKSELKQYGRELVGVCQQAEALDIDISRPVIPRSLPNYRQISAGLKEYTQSRADELEIPSSFLCSKKRIDQFMVGYHQKGESATLGGWRGDYLDEGFKTIITSFT